MKKGILKRLLFFSTLLLCLEASAKAKKESKGAAKLDLSAVKQVVHSHLRDVQKCYTDLIIEGMATKGKVTAQWDIDDKGAVQNLSIKENTSKDQALEGCVTERVVNWTFPPAEPGKTFPVSYPFQFGN
jgi:inosine-uridine nucleoside N-ribohydrolase